MIANFKRCNVFQPLNHERIQCCVPEIFYIYNSTVLGLYYQIVGLDRHHHRAINFQFVGVRVMIMMLNATFNNISVISWRSVLLIDETRVPGEKHQPSASH